MSFFVCFLLLVVVVVVYFIAEFSHYQGCGGVEAFRRLGSTQP